MRSMNRSPLALETLEGRDAPAFVVSLASTATYTSVTQVAPTSSTVVQLNRNLVSTTVPMTWAAPTLTSTYSLSSILLPALNR